MGYDIDAGEQVQAADLEQIYRAAGPYAESSTGNDSYAATFVPAPDTLEAGMVFRFKADVANTGPCSLNPNSKGAKTIKKWGAGGKQDLSTGDIQANMIVTVEYDGTDMLMISAQQPRPLYACGQTNRVAGSGTGTQNIAHGLGVIPRLIKITAFAISTTNAALTTSVGTATGTSDETCTYAYSNNNPIAIDQSSNKIIQTVTSGGSAGWSAEISALDETNITLNFTAATTPGTLYIQWEAYA